MSNPEPLKLDRKRSFGVVYNDPNIGYAQDGHHFRPDGTLYLPPEATKTTTGEAQTAKSADLFDSVKKPGAGK